MWYPSRIVENYERPRLRPSGDVEMQTGQNVILIHLDTTCEIPDALFDPDSVNQDIFK